jgi:hypothetical protein
MDPLTAFSLAAGIIQIVQLSSSVVSTAQEICQSGSTEQNIQTELITEDFKMWNSRLKTWNPPDMQNFTPLSEADQVPDYRIVFQRFEVTAN